MPLPRFLLALWEWSGSFRGFTERAECAVYFRGRTFPEWTKGMPEPARLVEGYGLGPDLTLGGNRPTVLAQEAPSRVRYRHAAVAVSP